MKLLVSYVAVAFYLLAHSAWASAPALDKLKVLYIGDPSAPRAAQFASFLKTNVARVEIASRSTFRPEQAADFDVVVLDWPQSGSLTGRQSSPLGERAAWNKPTVLLGSAGLNLAVVWKVRGGSG